MDRNLLEKLNGSDSDVVLSPYSFDKAVDGAKYVLGMTSVVPDMSTMEGMEEYNSWYSDGEQPEYDGRATDVFSDAKWVPLAKDPDLTASVINNDCSETTHGMISGIVGPEKFMDAKDLVGVVMNTIYLKQGWEYDRTKDDEYMFDGEETEGMKSDGTEKAASFWFETGPVYTMLLKDGFRFHAYMPKDISKGLSDKNIAFLFNHFKQTTKYVDATVKMPFIKTESELSCDFSDLDGNRLDVSHKAKIDCNEKGVEAAAATVIKCLSGCCFGSDEKKILEINLDKPFFFFIEKEGKVLFVGKKVGSYLKKNKTAEEIAEVI